MLLSMDEKDLIKKLYIEDGLNTVEISNMINRGQNTIERYLKANDIYQGRRVKELIDKQSLQCIIGRYLLGETSREIFNDYKKILKSPDAILYLLKKHNILRRPAQRRSVVKYHDYFQDITTERQAYFLGFMIADGSIIKKKDKKNDVISFGLKKSDKYIVDIFAKELGYVGTITNSKEMVVIQFASQKMSLDLEKYGVIKRKSYLGTTLPPLNDELMPHLIRGFFDGNGTVYVDKNKHFNWGFYGSQLICEQIRDFLMKKLSIECPKVFNKGSVSFIYLHSKIRTPKFYDFIYSNASIYLHRKKEKFKYYLSNTEVTS